jgi:hypothetical protein
MAPKAKRIKVLRMAATSSHSSADVVEIHQANMLY